MKNKRISFAKETQIFTFLKKGVVDSFEENKASKFPQRSTDDSDFTSDPSISSVDGRTLEEEEKIMKLVMMKFQMASIIVFKIQNSGFVTHQTWEKK